MKIWENYAKHPGGCGGSEMVKCRMEEEGAKEPLDPEQARRILRDEMPRRIERLRREFLNVYRGERGKAIGDREAEETA